VAECGSSPGDYLATSVAQLVTLLFAKYAGEVVMALPSDKSVPRALGKRTASNGLALGLISGLMPRGMPNYAQNVCSSG
jgi:hypothetical protein